jgi:lactoylglutathione lyase
MKHSCVQMRSMGFKVLGIQQVAIGGLDKKALSNFWVDTLGVKKVGDYVAEKENVDEDILQLGSGPHAVEIDLMQPLNPDVAPKVRTLL